MFFYRFKKIILFFLFIIVVVGMVLSQNRWPSLGQKVGGFLGDTSLGIQSSLVRWSGGISDFFFRHFSNSASYDEVLKLRRKVDRLKTAAILLEDVSLENEYLKKLLQVKERIEGPKPLLGRLVARTGAPLIRTIRLNVGYSNGVKKGDGVLSDAGVVGQVISVGKYTCEVLLVTDATSAIDVKIERSGAHGILHGRNSAFKYQLSVEDFDRLQDVKVKDVVVASGIGAKFPVGTPVGEVIKADTSNEDVYVKALVRPYTDFARLDQVLVLISDGNEKGWRLKDVLNLDKDLSEQSQMSLMRKE